VIDGFVEAVNARIESGTLSLPDYSPSTGVLSVSDYAGQNKNSRFDVLTYFIAGAMNVIEWRTKQSQFRKEHLDFTRRMQFKKLKKDRQRARVVPRFLETFDGVEGIVLTFAIEKQLRYLFSVKSPHQLLHKIGLRDMSPHVAEHLLRALHFQAPLAFAVTKEHHHYDWISDRDPSLESRTGVDKLMWSVFSHYATHRLAGMSFMARPTGFDWRFDDLLDFVDLVAGSIHDLLHGKSNSSPQFRGKITSRVDDRADSVLAWYTRRSSKPIRLLCIVKSVPPEKMSIQLMDLRKLVNSTGAGRNA